VLVTYDEFGGTWDHVAPPGQGNHDGPADAYGPGTRVPALVIGGPLRKSAVDHTSYDTTSVLATIEHRWHLAALGTRDGAVNDLGKALQAGGSQHR
jgi:phospholipase C